MNEGRQKILDLLPRISPLALDDHGKVFNMELIEALQLYSVIDLAQVIAVGALAREESRGAHFRSDFKERDDTSWLKHTLAHCHEDGPRLTYGPVSITSVPLAKRIY
jgi:succinate dehydrogenase / fumarate reductase flavoprotein subunit